MARAQHGHLGKVGVNMDAVQGGLDRDSWMERARPVRVVPAVTTELEPEVRPSVRTESAGWDPHDVWLHRIHRPRERQAAEQ